MRRNREFIERLGDLPADLQTKHDRHMPVAVTRRDPRMSQGAARPGQQPALVPVRLASWHFVTVAASKQYLSARENRRYLLIQNNSAADLWANYSADAGNSVGIKIVSGGSQELWASMFGDGVTGPGNALYVWAAAAGGVFTVLEA